MAELGSALPIRQQLLDRLSALDSLVLQSSISADLSIVASIPESVISESSYGDTNMTVLVNQFEVAASFGSSAFSLELPISLPSGPDIINFNVTDGSFSRKIFVNTLAQVDIWNLFPDYQDSNSTVNLDYGGTFEANLPINVGMAGVDIGVSLIINDTNIFEPNPLVDYAINMCDVSATMMELFDQLKVQIVKAVKAPFGDKPVIFDIDRLTDPLISKVDSILTNVTRGTNVTLSASDCSRRLGVIDSVSAPGALARSIKDAFSFVNEEVVAGFVLSADISPYFNIDTFSVGVSASLSATIEQTAEEVLDLVSDYIASSTDSSTDSSVSKLGLGYSDGALRIDLDELLSKVALAAGLDVTFGIDISLAKIQDGIFTSRPFDEALRKGIALNIDTWGAFAEIIVDPIELDISLFGRNISIEDSHFATSAELRSRGKFIATIDDMIVGGSAIDTSPLIPDLIVPLSTEFMFNIPMTDQIIVSPIMSAESENLIGTDLVFNFDVDVGTFLNNDYVGNNTLTTVLETATNFLQEVASLQLQMNASEIPSSLEGFFSIVNELNDLGTEFLTYIDLVDQGT